MTKVTSAMLGMNAWLGVLSLWLWSCTVAAVPVEGGIEWQRDDAAAFAQAQRERRFVLLYLEAVWCHWCHVMDRQTYADPTVRELVGAHYVPLRIDQDSRPDLAARYRDYGWPATIVFAADGSEIVKRQGYIAAAPFARLLRAIVDDPSPERRTEDAAADATPASALAPTVLAELQRRHRATFDAEQGGLRGGQKYLERDAVEYDLWLGASGDAAALARARKTLDAALALLDPIWGGVYQYSTHGDWQHPHYERLTTLQGEYLRSYALAFALTGEPRYRQAVQDIRRYLAGFMRSTDGGYYASQDADLEPGQHSAAYYALDDAGRRALGLPRIDRNRYAREAGTVAEALAYWYEVSGEAEALDEARAAVRWAQRERVRQGGGFRHGDAEDAALYLADNLALGRAMLQLYRSTGEREWLGAAVSVARSIDAELRGPSGFLAAPVQGQPIRPVAQIDENIAAGRWLNLLARYSGDAAIAAMADHAFAHLARREVALSRITEAGILLLDAERARDPLHLAIVGGKHDPDAAALYAAGLRLPAVYKRIDWWDPAEGPLPNADVKYPPVRRASAFVCTERRCSLPIVRPDELAAFVADSR